MVQRAPGHELCVGDGGLAIAVLGLAIGNEQLKRGLPG
jgi:hypothetical protein